MQKSLSLPLLQQHTEAARDTANKHRATTKLSPKIHSLSAALWSCELSQEQSRTLGEATWNAAAL